MPPADTLPQRPADEARPAPTQAAPGGGDDPMFLSGGFSPRRLLAVLRRQWPLIVGFTVLIFLAAAAFTFLQPKKYTASASVVLQKQVVDANGVASVVPASADQVDTEVQVLMSRQLVSEVVDRERLGADPEFSKGAARKGAPGSKPYQDAVVEAVQKGVGAKRRGLTAVIDVAVTSRDPRKSAVLANTLAQQYLDDQQASKTTATKGASSDVNSRLDELRNSATNARAQVAAFENSHNLVSDAGAQLTAQEISTYNQQAASAKAQYDTDQAHLGAARALLAGDAKESAALDSPVIEQLRSKAADVTGQIASLTDNYGPRHPDVLKAKAQLIDINSQIHTEAQRIVADLEVKSKISRERLSSINGSLSQTRGKLAGSNTDAVRLAELQSQAAAAKTIYETFLARYKTTAAQTGTERPDAAIQSRAEPPARPSSPKVGLNLALGLLAGLGAGAAAAYGREKLNSGLAAPEDVERKLGLPCLGSVPNLGQTVTGAEKKIPPVEYIVAKPFSAFGEAIRALRTSIRYARVDKPVKVIAVTSALPAEGKTTTSVCIARSAAQAGSRVLLIDCDLRRQNVSAVLNLKPEKGLLELLGGGATLEQVLIKDEASGMSVLPVAEGGFSPKDVFESLAMGGLLSRLRDDYDLIVLDTAPLLVVADSRTIGARADAVVFLARWRQTPEHAIVQALKLLDSAGAYIAGVALTQVDVTGEAGYGYGYGYGSRKYKQYYAS